MTAGRARATWRRGASSRHPSPITMRRTITLVAGGLTMAAFGSFGAVAPRLAARRRRIRSRSSTQFRGGTRIVPVWATVRDNGGAFRARSHEGRLRGPRQRQAAGHHAVHARGPAAVVCRRHRRQHEHDAGLQRRARRRQPVRDSADARRRGPHREFRRPDADEPDASRRTATSSSTTCAISSTSGWRTKRGCGTRSSDARRRRRTPGQPAGRRGLHRRRRHGQCHDRRHVASMADGRDTIIYAIAMWGRGRRSKRARRPNPRSSSSRDADGRRLLRAPRTRTT